MQHFIKFAVSTAWLGACGAPLPMQAELSSGSNDGPSLKTLDDMTDAGFGKQTCAGAEDGVVVTREFAAEEAATENVTVGSIEEHYRELGGFGHGPNAGFTNRERTIVNGAPTTRQPAHIRCSPGGWAAVGWQFSGNVAALNIVSKVKLNTTRAKADGGAQRVVISGERSYRFSDPASTPPVADGSGYYDLSANDGEGRSVVYRTARYGGLNHPNQVRVTNLAAGLTTENESLDNEQHTRAYWLQTPLDRPIVERLERRITPASSLISRTLVSGTFLATYPDGAQVLTDVGDLQYRRQDHGTCRPLSGKLTNTYVPHVPPTPGRPTVVITRRYDGATPPATKIKCIPADAPRCEQWAERLEARYGPLSCLY